MAVRRLVKFQKDSISFAALLEDMRDNHTLLSRKRFIALYSDDLKDLGEKDFDHITGASDLKCVELAMISEDLDQLKAVAKTIEDFAESGQGSGLAR